MSNYPYRTDDPDDPDGVIVQSYIDRLRNVSSFYTYLTDRGDTRDEMGTYYTGWTGFLESHARTPPEDRRNVMIDVQQDWALKSLTTPNFYVTNIDPDNVGAGITFGYGPDATGFYDPANASGITFAPIPTEWRNDPRVIAEFTRQANMGVPYLSGGLTPGSQGATMGTYKSVAKRLFNDMAEYVRSRGTDNVVQFTDFGASLVGDTSYVPSVALRSQIASGGKSWWRRSFWHPNLSDSVNYSKEKGILDDLADASLSADMYGGSVFNWFPNMGDEIAEGAWYAAAQRLVDAGGGVSSAAATNFDLDDLNYWAAKGAGSLLHEYYKHVDGLATSQSNSAYRKGLAMVVQLDAPVVARPDKAGGGVYAAQKWGYMKDHNLAAQIDILGAFGATDANAPNLRKPDQIWVKSSAWYNNKLLFEAGTGNYADASFLGFPDDNYTSRFAVLTARNQVEKRLFKRPIMQREAPVGASEEDILQQLGLDDASPEAQAARLAWLETNTLPNVYWDARVGGGYSEGASNNIRFWSATTGNCLPSPCVFDKTSPIAAFLNMNNDIYKNDVRVAFKKWVSENNVQSIEAAYRSLSNIYFTPVVQQKDIPVFVDPDILLPWSTSTRTSEEFNAFWSNGPTGGQQYVRRLLKAATPYTLIDFASRVFHTTPSSDSAAYYDKAILYYGAVYGATANVDLQLLLGDPTRTNNPNNLLTGDGIMGGKSLPPYMSRAVMWNVERPWLVLLYSSDVGAGTPEYPIENHPDEPALNFKFLTDDYCCGDNSGDDATYNFLRNNALSLNPAVQTNAEFQRQANLGAEASPYLFPDGPSTNNGLGLTPGSPQTTLGTYRKVIAKLWNDLSEYTFNNPTYRNTAKNLIHYAGYPIGNQRWLVNAGVRTDSNPNIPPFKTYWQGDYGVYSARTNDSFFNPLSFTADIAALYQAQASANSIGIPNYNRMPNHPDYAEGITYCFGSTPVPLLKDSSSTPIGQDYRFGDLRYWQTKELGTVVGRYKDSLVAGGVVDKVEIGKKKFGVILMPNLLGDNTKGPFGWNRWAGAGRKDPTITGTIDALSCLAQSDQYNPYAEPVDQIWIWDSATTYWWRFATTSGFGGLSAWYRNNLEIMLFERPVYTEAIKAKMAEQYEQVKLSRTSGGVGGVPTLNVTLSSIDAAFGTWLSNGDAVLGNSNLGNTWWLASNNAIWYDPNDGGSKLPAPCNLSTSCPLAPWLNFNEQIRTPQIHVALRQYISDYNCKYVEAIKDTIRRFRV